MGDLHFADGRAGNVVVVGPARNPKGAALVMPSPSGGTPVTTLFVNSLGVLAPATVVEILCMQERVFGTRGFPPPEGLS